jgi:hypothetical protein
MAATGGFAAVSYFSESSKEVQIFVQISRMAIESCLTFPAGFRKADCHFQEALSMLLESPMQL